MALTVRDAELLGLIVDLSSPLLITILIGLLLGSGPP